MEKHFYARMDDDGPEIVVQLSRSTDFGVICNASGKRLIIGDYMTMRQFVDLIQHHDFSELPPEPSISAPFEPPFAGALTLQKS